MNAQLKIIYQIILTLLFLMISTVDFSSYSLIFLVFIVGAVWVISNRGRLFVPWYLYAAVGVYLFFLIIGILNHHSNPTIDIKFQIYGFLFYLFLINYKTFNIFRFLFLLNALVFIIYIAVYLGVLPSLWHDTTIGFKGRVYGPSIIPIVLIGFYYLYTNKRFDVWLLLSYLFALPYLVFTTNLMNIVIAGALLFLIVVNVRNLLKPIYLFAIAGIVMASIVFLNSKFAPELIKEKLPYVVKPWEYDSLRTRIDDFKKAVIVEDYSISETLIGKGFGAHTTIYRENEKAKSLSGFFTFQEIDNGFYYLFHRGGILLLLIFFLTHLYLLKRIPSFKAKAGFAFIVVFTNLLSIHYFNNMFYLIMAFCILHRVALKNESLFFKRTSFKSSNINSISNGMSF